MWESVHTKRFLCKAVFTNLPAVLNLHTNMYLFTCEEKNDQSFLSCLRKLFSLSISKAKGHNLPKYLFPNPIRCTDYEQLQTLLKNRHISDSDHDLTSYILLIPHRNQLTWLPPISLSIPWIVVWKLQDQIKINICHPCHNETFSEGKKTGCPHLPLHVKSIGRRVREREEVLRFGWSLENRGWWWENASGSPVCTWEGERDIRDWRGKCFFKSKYLDMVGRKKSKASHIHIIIEKGLEIKVAR